MPVIESGPLKGKRADIILNCLGIFNRKIPSVLYEQEINFIMSHVSSKCKKLIYNKDTKKIIVDKIPEAYEIFFDILKKINIQQCKYTLNLYEKLTAEDRYKFWVNIIEDKFYIHQPPFYGNIKFTNLVKIYEKYKWVKPFKFKNINQRLVMGKIYFIKLRHHPKTKFSTRATSYLNIKNTPSKSITYKANQQVYSKTPIRLGKIIAPYRSNSIM